jgi:DNA-binding transcriptional MerR regulator
MDLMTIGEFAARTRLSPKALRLYDRLGLLAPAQTDPATGYRLYSSDQVSPARLIGLLRRIDMPLPVIAGIVARPPDEAAAAVGTY